MIKLLLGGLLDTSDFLSNLLEEILKRYPTLSAIVLWITIGLVIVLIISIIYKNFFGGKKEKQANDVQLMKSTENSQSLSQKPEYLAHMRDCLDATKEILNCSGQKFDEDNIKLLNNLIQTIIKVPPLIMKKKDTDKLRLAFFEPFDEYLKISTGQGFSEEGKANFKLKVDEGIAGYAFSRKRSIYSNDVNNDSYFKKHDKMRNFNSLLCVPVVSNSESKAVISIEANDKDAFNLTDITYVEGLASLMSIIYEINTCKNKKDTLNKLVNISTCDTLN